jgi:hypothetical protein
VLTTQLDQAGSTSVGVLTQALRVVLAARKINQQAVARFDLGFVPFLVTDAAEGIGLLIYKCSLDQDKTRGSVLKIDVTSNPLVAGISLFNMFQTGTQPLEVIFTAEASKVALQALSIMRINLANNGRDVLLLLSTVGPWLSRFLFSSLASGLPWHPEYHGTQHAWRLDVSWLACRAFMEGIGKCNQATEALRQAGTSRHGGAVRTIFIPEGCPEEGFP